MEVLRIVILLILSMLSATEAGPDPQVPCFFIFGDSLVDNGNNNGILTLARANYLPYGVDFPEGASGRFSNGRTTVDILAQLLGFRNFIPSYSAVQRNEVLRGVNFASGAAGIRDETGNNLGEHYSFAEQIEHFRDVVQVIRRLFQRNETKLYDHLSKCIFFVGMGSNDYLNNYFMPNYYTTSSDFSPKTYSAVLLDDYSRLLNQLYDLGARKVTVTGIGQIGCIPYELARLRAPKNKTGSRCNENINKAINIFNAGLLQMVKRFNSAMEDAKVIYLNTYESSKDLTMNAISYGFTVVDKGCCGVGRNNGQITCLPLQTPCSNRSSHLFWDAFHPTEAANQIYAMKAYNSTSASDVYPINLKQLAIA
ncbi:GDSL esterase/lipase At1g33811 [Phalaenopsis equestris]|uniref:GDSL esterase/lipase At1g33811 n=1 Tax=Phalaenopsis equestris TaxID=78828 RepID=UPI0009E5F8EE|nr:GDSL esterase/lipase At1g33811 [Phalaenopsis equestris]